MGNNNTFIYDKSFDPELEGISTDNKFKQSIQNEIFLSYWASMRMILLNGLTQNKLTNFDPNTLRKSNYK